MAEYTYHFLTVLDLLNSGVNPENLGVFPAHGMVGVWVTPDGLLVCRVNGVWEFN